jgi:hypothetical protein
VDHKDVGAVQLQTVKEKKLHQMDELVGSLISHLDEGKIRILLI